MCILTCENKHEGCGMYSQSTRCLESNQQIYSLRVSLPPSLSPSHPPPPMSLPLFISPPACLSLSVTVCVFSLCLSDSLCSLSLYFSLCIYMYIYIYKYIYSSLKLSLSISPSTHSITHKHAQHLALAAQQCEPEDHGIGSGKYEAV
jgi:hypothetical protein